MSQHKQDLYKFLQFRDPDTPIGTVSAKINSLLGPGRDAYEKELAELRSKWPSSSPNLSLPQIRSLERYVNDSKWDFANNLVVHLPFPDPVKVYVTLCYLISRVPELSPILEESTSS